MVTTITVKDFETLCKSYPSFSISVLQTIRQINMAQCELSIENNDLDDFIQFLVSVFLAMPIFLWLFTNQSCKSKLNRDVRVIPLCKRKVVFSPGQFSCLFTEKQKKVILLIQLS